MKLKKVLLIDDDDTVNFISKKLIERSGLADEIVVHNKAQEALDTLKDEVERGDLPQLIFVDINMPDVNGWEFIEKFSEMGSQTEDTKIILLTSLINISDLQRASDISAISALREKPVSLEMLEEIQRELL